MKKILSRFLLPVLLLSCLLPADLVFALDDTRPYDESTLVQPASDVPQEDPTEQTADFETTGESTQSEPETQATLPAPAETERTSEQPDATRQEPSDAPTEPAEEPTEPTAVSSEPEPTAQTEPSSEPEPAPVIRLNQIEVRCGVGETFRLFAQDETGRTVAVLFSIDNSAVLRETAPGSFTAVSAGQAVVTARAETGATASCVVSVLPAPEQIFLKETEITLGIGETYALQASLPAGTYTAALQYESGDSHVLAHVSGSTFRARHSGTATITVTAQNGVFAVCTVTVKKAPKTLTLSETDLTLGVGETLQLATTLPKNTWCSALNYTSDTKAVTVSADGRLTARKKGTATVTVTAQNGGSASCSVTVKKAPKKITVPKTIKLNPGDDYTFMPVVKEGYASHSFTVKSGKKKIAAVAEGLTITAKKRGTATVTVSAYNGVSAQCEVRVLPLPDQFRFQKSAYHTTMGRHITPKFVLPNDTWCSRYTLTSSDPYVAEITEYGAIACRSIGTAQIKAETPNGKTAVCTVTVSALAVPAVSQLPSYPTGCEAASCTALLRYYGYNITLSGMVAAIPRENIVYKNGRRYGPSINKKFVGNPAGSYTSGVPGYGAFSPVIRKSLQKVINSQGGSDTAKRISGCSFETLLAYLSEGHPAIVWSTYNMLVPQTVNSWYIPQPNGTAKYFQYPRGTHVTVLKGYTRTTVTMMDPYGGSTKTFNRSTFQARWNLLGKQAVVIV